MNKGDQNVRSSVQHLGVNSLHHTSHSSSHSGGVHWAVREEELLRENAIDADKYIKRCSASCQHQRVSQAKGKATTWRGEQICGLAKNTLGFGGLGFRVCY